MTEKENRFALRFEFPVKTLEKKDDDKSKNSFYEFFIPYSAYTLIENELLTLDEKNLISLCSTSSGELDNHQTEQFIDSDFGKFRINEDWINENGRYEEICAFDYIADFVFVTELMDLNKDNEKKVIGLGMLTEFMKFKFFSFKIDFSILYIIFHDAKFEENINNKINFELYKKVIFDIAKRIFPAEKNVFTDNYIEKQLTENKKKFFLEVAAKSKKEIQDELIKIYEVTYTENAYLSTIAQNIEKYANYKYTRKYKGNNSGCYCTIDNGAKKYFSLSGIYDTKQFGFVKLELLNLIEKIEIALNEKYKEKFDYCSFSDKVKSYGIKTERNFIFFPEPVSCLRPYPFPYITIHYPLTILDFEGVCRELYSCCERKIFAKIQSTSLMINSSPMKVFCRWAPCEKCQTAVFEEISKHDFFEYVALAKDSYALKKYVQSFNKSELKLWKLTKNETS